jgi:hypothetical protein
MKTLLLWRDKITRWFTSKDYNNWKTIFFSLSVLFGLFVTLKFEYDTLIFWTAIITSITIAWSLFELFGVATVRINSARVSLAWGFINYSLFVTIASLLLSKKEWGGNSYILGIGLAFIASFILVRICSYISYLLKLNEEKEDESIFYNKESRFNRCNFYIVLSIFLLIFLIDKEGTNIKNYEYQKKIEQQTILFSKEKWYTVTEWHTEILNGNTIYIIKCAKGRLGIYPSKYPQIRDINSKTQIKYLNGEKKGGVVLPEKLEIKN